MFSLESFVQKARELGHSEEYITVTSAYISNLNKRGLPILFTRKHLSELFDISYHRLTKIIDSNHSPQIEHIGNYDFFKLRKKSGKLRQIMASRDILKQIQIWINEYILSKVEISEFCTGFVKNRSIKDNAIPHLNQEVILKIDLKDFFTSITQERVCGMFKGLGYHPNLAYDLAMLTTACTPNSKSYLFTIDGDLRFLDIPSGSFALLSKEDQEKAKILPPHAFLPQGAPSSPAITNIICRKLDYRFSKLAESKGCNYTRYADDITFSGIPRQIPSVNLLRFIVQEEGFILNEEKIRFIRNGQKKYVTGLDVSGDVVKVPRKFKYTIEKHLFFCKKYGVVSHMKHTKNVRKHFDEWLWGCICFVYSIEKEVGSKMMHSYNELDWSEFQL